MADVSSQITVKSDSTWSVSNGSNTHIDCYLNHTLEKMEGGSGQKLGCGWNVRNLLYSTSVCCLDRLPKCFVSLVLRMPDQTWHSALASFPGFPGMWIHNFSVTFQYVGAWERGYFCLQSARSIVSFPDSLHHIYSKLSDWPAQWKVETLLTSWGKVWWRTLLSDWTS